MICASKAPGFALERLHLGLVSNLSYMDHNETKLWVNGPLDGHAINSDVAVGIGNMVSSKTSHLAYYVKKLVTHHPENQNTNLSKVSLGNGAIKGFRLALEKVRYAGIVSSEPTHTIRTPYLEEPDGCQLLPRVAVQEV